MIAAFLSKLLPVQPSDNYSYTTSHGIPKVVFFKWIPKE